MSYLYTRRLSAITGEAGDDDSDSYGVFGGVAADACSLIVASCVLAASVVIWEACALAATVVVCRTSDRRRRKRSECERERVRVVFLCCGSSSVF